VSGRDKDLSWRVAWSLPGLLVLVPLALELTLHREVLEPWWDDERGVLEKLTLVLALFGMFQAIALMRAAHAASRRGLTAWMTPAAGPRP